MSEHNEQADPLPAASDEQNLAALIKQLQKQVTFLEKKIDQMISQSSGRPFSGGKSYSKPYRSFDRPRSYSDGVAGRSGGEKNFERGSHFKKCEGEESRGFGGYKKKSYGDHRESAFGQERHFARRSDGPREGFEHKKKSSFPYKRKSRE